MDQKEWEARLNIYDAMKAFDLILRRLCNGMDHEPGCEGEDEETCTCGLHDAIRMIKTFKEFTLEDDPSEKVFWK